MMGEGENRETLRELEPAGLPEERRVDAESGKKKIRGREEDRKRERERVYH